MATNGRVARDDSSWMRRATRSLPTPLSPVISTVESTCATRRASSSTFCISSERATMPAGSSTPSPRRSSCCFLARSLRSASLSAVGHLAPAPRRGTACCEVASARRRRRRPTPRAACRPCGRWRRPCRRSAPRRRRSPCRCRTTDSRWRSPSASSTPARPRARSAAGAARPRTTRATAPRRTAPASPGARSHRLDAHEALQRVQPPARDLPLALVLPRELRAASPPPCASRARSRSA